MNKTMPLASRRSVLKGMAGTALGLGAGRLVTFGSANASEIVSIQQQLDWLPSNQILGDVVAQQLGFYRDEGLDVTIAPGGPNFNGIPAVASGQVFMGSVSSSPHIMLARAGGIPIKCIACGYQQHPFSYVSLPSNPIRTPQDLRGKRVGIPPSTKVLLQLLLAKHGIPEDEVTILPTGGEPGPLLAGQVDAISDWETDAILNPLGPDRVVLRLWDSGIQLYANPYYVRDQTLQESPEQIAAFIRATAKGWAYAYANREEAVRLYVEAYPSSDFDIELGLVDKCLSYVFNEETARLGWGTMQPDIWRDQILMYDSLGQFADNPVPTVEEMMTMSILEATDAARPRLG